MLALSLTGLGCSGQISTSDQVFSANNPNTTSPDSTSTADAAESASDGSPAGLRRLNNAEYNHTVRDLLGVASTPAQAFIADEKAAGFDNVAAVQGMTEAQFQQYSAAAEALAAKVFADPALQSAVLGCEPATGRTCGEAFIAGFVPQAYRRPITSAEAERLLRVYDQAITLGESTTGALQLTLHAILASPHFIYRVEDPSAADTADADAYALASRLSYLLWSSMPDAELFALAASGDLLTTETLEAQVERMLADPKSQRFVQNFAGQWLGLRDLTKHRSDVQIFPDYNQALLEEMVAEGYAYFAEFLFQDRSLDTFFTADLHFVGPELAALYGFADVPASATQPVSDPSNTRRGFLGLASFLTLSSFSYRTAPTLRGKWVLENLLCNPIPPPPTDVPQLDGENEELAELQSQNIRERLAVHREQPQCAGCHNVLDPIGFGLEAFDAIGRHRTHYDNGDLIDSSGEFPDGSTFQGLEELSTILSHDERFTACVSSKMLTYALGRELTSADTPQLTAIRSSFSASGLHLRGLLQAIVQSPLFHGDAQ